MALIRFLLLFLPLSAFGQLQPNLQAPNPEFDWVDQKNGIGNACGPASLLNSFGSGTERWATVFEKIHGKDDRNRIGTIIKTWGLKPSSHLPDRNRWQTSQGIGLADLADMANEMRALGTMLPRLETEFFFVDSNKQPEKQLRIAHKRLKKSLKKGFPPILSVRRFVQRKNQWLTVHGHFVTLIAIPEKLPKSSTEFPVTYLDPIGGRKLVGTLQATPNSPSLIFVAPQSDVGKRLIKSDELTHLGLAAALGAW